MTMDTENKVCTKCGESKPQDAFAAQRGKTRAACKDCNVKHNREYRQRPEVVARNEAKKKAFKDKHGVCKTIWRTRNGDQSQIIRKEAKKATDRMLRCGGISVTKNQFLTHWQNKGWREAITEFYKQRDWLNISQGLDPSSKDCYVVDHIKPVAAFAYPPDAWNPDNLQVITWAVNMAKGTR